jgi:hypothetical protein
VISEISEGQVSMGYGGDGAFRRVLQRNVAFPALWPPRPGPQISNAGGPFAPPIK